MIITPPTIRPNNRKSYRLAAGKKPTFIKISMNLHNEKEMLFYSSNFSVSSLAPAQRNMYKVVASILKE